MKVLQTNYFYMNRLSPKGAGIALAVTLAIVFALCALAQYMNLGFQASHMWLNLFSASEMGSASMWINGLLASLVVGGVTGFIFARTYNRFAR